MFSLSRPSICSAKGSADAGVAKLADAPDLGSGAARRGGSSPFTRTTKLDLLRIPVKIFVGTQSFQVNQLYLGFERVTEKQLLTQTRKFVDSEAF